MDQSPERIVYLWKQFASKQASREELDDFFDHISKAEGHESDNVFFDQYFSDPVAGEKRGKEFWSNQRQSIMQACKLQDDIINGTIPGLKSVSPSVHRVHFLKTGWFRYAALLLLVAGTATFLYRTYQRPQKEIATTIREKTAGIKPGGSKAMLTLSDGSTILLDSAANGSLAEQGNTKIIKLGDGKLAYNSAGGKAAGMNTVSTPKGGQYQVSLPDGTKVWLNAASSITFPTIFTGGKREVRVSGETYFEVAADQQKPFTVFIEGHSMVEVLGTSFNINAYGDDSDVKTTLVEGKVRIINTAVSTDAASRSRISGALPVLLSPGQQAVITAIGKQQNSPGILVRSNANVEQILAWKNGLFNFNGLALKAVMRQLERWYDIDVKYEGSPSALVFRGEMYRDANLNDVLEMFKKMGVKFKIQGKILTLME